MFDNLKISDATISNNQSFFCAVLLQLGLSLYALNVKCTLILFPVA